MTLNGIAAYAATKGFAFGIEDDPRGREYRPLFVLTRGDERAEFTDTVAAVDYLGRDHDA